MNRRHATQLTAASLLALLCASVVSSPAAAQRVRRPAPLGAVRVLRVPAAIAPGIPNQWRGALNHYRKLATPALPDVVENAPGQPENYSYWALWHSKYMVNNQDGFDHEETDGMPGYHANGDHAAKAGLIAASSRIEQGHRWAIEGLLTAPFHGLQMLDPRLQESGFGQFSKQNPSVCTGPPQPCMRTAATLNHADGDDHDMPNLTLPIKFPGNGKTFYLDKYDQTETPNPFGQGPCTSYDGPPSQPTGPPIYLIFGPATPVDYVPQTSSFKQGNTQLDFCGFDGDEYGGGHGAGLTELNAIFLFPRKPLKSEKTYTVSIDTDLGDPVTWSFKVGDLVAPTSRVKKPSNNQTLDQDPFTKLNGTSSGDTERVDIAIAHFKNQKCRFMNGSGNFGTQKNCFKQTWLRANGKADWSYTLPKKLPATFNPQTGAQNGQYLVFSRGRDEVGNVETKFTEARNLNGFHVTP